MRAALLGPAFEDTFDVAPVPGIEFGRFAEGVFEPGSGIGCGGFEEPFADEGSDGADVFFVHTEDAGAGFDDDFVGDGFGFETEFATLSPSDDAA